MKGDAGRPQGQAQVSVERAEGNGAEDQQIEGAGEQLSLVGHMHS